MLPMVAVVQNASHSTHATTFLASAFPLFLISREAENDCLTPPFSESAGFGGCKSILSISTPSGRLTPCAARTFLSCCLAKYYCGFVARSHTSVKASRKEL